MSPIRLLASAIAALVLALAACNEGPPAVDPHEKRVGSPVSAITAASPADDDMLGCDDVCGDPDCSCLDEPALPLP